MAYSCFTVATVNPLKRLKTKFHRRSVIDEIPEGRRMSFEQFLNDHFAATRQRHDPSDHQPSFYHDATTAPDLDHRTVYRFSSTDTVSVVDTTLDPRSPLPNQQRSPIPAMPELGNAASEETITILLQTNNQRDSEDTATLPSGPLGHALKTDFRSHPAIIDNPPPFTRHSDPPIERPYITSPKISAKSARPRLTYQESRFHLLHQRGQLHASRERFVDRLEATTQDLSLTAEKLHLVQQELLIREEQAAHLRRQLCSLDNTHNGALRTLTAAAAELEMLKAEHASCGCLAGLWRRTPLLKRYRIELKAKAEGLEAALKTSRRDVRNMHERFRVQELELVRLAKMVEVERREAQSAHQAQLEENEAAAALMAHLRHTEAALSTEREVADGIRQHNRDLQLEIACLKHRVSTRTV
jgi:hypothetical protein